MVKRTGKCESAHVRLMGSYCRTQLGAVLLGNSELQVGTSKHLDHDAPWHASLFTPKLQCYSCYPCWQAWWTELSVQNQQATVKMGDSWLRQRNTGKDWIQVFHRPTHPTTLSLLWGFPVAWATLPQTKKEISLWKASDLRAGPTSMKKGCCEHIYGAAISRQDGLSSSWTGLSPWKGLASPCLTCVRDVAGNPSKKG